MKIKNKFLAIFLLLTSFSVFAQTPEEMFVLYKNEVTTSVNPPEEKEKLIKVMSDAMNQNNHLIGNQYFVIVDRNPLKQNFYIAFYDSVLNKISLSEPVKVSTGSLRKKHFITPLGWFENLPEHGSYRALGTKNENGVRGYGVKGMRVWDFGWQPAQAGWRKDPYIIDIRLQMHATDPDIMEQRLGKPDSQGCVRVQAKLNNFLDKYGVIDKKYEEISSKAWVLRKDRMPVKEAGSFLLVIETP